MDRSARAAASRSRSCCGASPPSAHAVARLLHRAEAPDVNPRRQDGPQLRDARPAPPPGSRIARFLLGLGEAATSRPPSRRSPSGSRRRSARFATGIFNSGTNVGALVTPLVVPWITLHWGWEWAFIVDRPRSGSSGWSGGCVVYQPPEKHPSVTPAELALHPQRPAGSDHADALGAGGALPPDLGVRDRQVHDRSDLVAVPVLDPRFPQAQPRPRSQIDRPADRRHLPDRRRRQHRRRLAVVAADQARLERQRGAQDGDADLRAVRGADHLRVEGGEPVGGGGASSRSPRPRTRAGRRTSSR